MNKELLTLYEDRDLVSLAKEAEQLDDTALCELMELFNDDLLVDFYRALDPDTAARALVDLPPEKQSLLLTELHDDELDDIMDEVSPEDTVEIIEDMPLSVANRIAEEDEFLHLLEERTFKVLRPLIATLPPADVATLLTIADKDDVALIFRILPKTLAADCFVELDADLQKFIIQRISDKELKAVMDELFVDDAVDLIEEMPANVVKRILRQSDKETRNSINEILNYPKSSAGSVMTVEMVRLTPTQTIKQAFDHIRKIGIDKETIYTCYVTDNKRKILGIVTAKDLMISSPDAMIGDVMTTNIVYAHTTDDKEEVVHTINKYGFLALPVVDNEERLVGIITVDDAMDIMQEENTEDLETMHAMLPSSKPYIKTNPLKIFWQRLPWLLFLMLSATFTGIILNSYEGSLGELGGGIVGGLLIACIPMLMGTGGNAGSQASVTIIRGLALDEIHFKDVFRILLKELIVALLLAVSLGLTCFIKLILIDNMIFGYDYTPDVCGVISVALAVTVVLAKVVGCTLPMLAKLLHLDPAVVASPFITTLVDALSLVVYCNIAIAYLG